MLDANYLTKYTNYEGQHLRLQKSYSKANYCRQK